MKAPRWVFRGPEIVPEGLPGFYEVLETQLPGCVAEPLWRSVVSDDSIIRQFGQAWEVRHHEGTAMAQRKYRAAACGDPPVGKHHRVSPLH